MDHEYRNLIISIFFVILGGTVGYGVSTEFFFWDNWIVVGLSVFVGAIVFFWLSKSAHCKCGLP